MNYISAILLAVLLSPAIADNKQHGAYLGAIGSEIPHWFKESFLEFEDDVAEAARQNKRVMIYFHQDGCPYCARLVDENFKDPQIESFVRTNFDGIAINMWGDREVVTVGGKGFTEKTFAEALKVQYTPTMLFLDERGKVALRLNGYYPPQEFRQALNYVAQKQESKQSFNQFMLAGQTAGGGGLISEDFFTDNYDLPSLLNRGKPLAVYFEAANCDECRVLHERVLTDAPTRKLLTRLNNVQLDVMSERKLVTPQGRSMSHKDYARQLDIGYTPSVVFFDEQGEEVFRIDGFLKTFHFQSSVDYVLEKGYIEQPSFQRYIAARGERLREQGYDTDIWGYESFHPAE